MKKLFFVLAFVFIPFCFTACSQNSTLPKEQKKIAGKTEEYSHTYDMPVPDFIPGSKETVADSFLHLIGWQEIDFKKVEVTPFPVYRDGKETDERYAVLTVKNESNDDVLGALVYYIDSHKSDDISEYIYDCNGTLVSNGYFIDGEPLVFGKLPIGKEKGEKGLRDIYVSYSDNGYVDLNGKGINCDENGFFTYLAQHGETVYIGKYKK